jgi:hypothetical protein
MPMIAVSEGGQTVYPGDVEQDAFVGTCPECGEQLTIRQGHYRDGDWVVQHFWHSRRAGGASGSSGSDNGGCPGVSVAESDEHKLMKYVVSRQLHHTFGHHATVTKERGIPETDRVADVVAEFDDKIPRLGNGIVVECQYKNNTKPKLAVTLEYLEAGYSVVWASKRHFSDKWRKVNLPDPTMPWPQMVPRKECWRGYTAGQEHLARLSAKRPPMDVNLPQELWDELQPVLERYHERGDTGHSWDVEQRLGEDNATRKCEVCSQPAEWYLLEWGRTSTHRCTTHHPTHPERGTSGEVACANRARQRGDGDV